MKLTQYLKENSITPASFAEKVGVSSVSIHRYCVEDRTPKKEVMRAIAQITNGAVTPNDFFLEATEAAASPN